MKSGILPFHFITHTDHRALYMEIDMQNYLTSQPSTISNQQHRSFNSKSPRGAVKYCQQLQKWLDDNSIEQELQVLSQTPKSSFSTQDKENLKSIDNVFHNARHHAEQGLSKYRNHPWSPHL